MKYFVTPQNHGLGWIPDVPDQRDYIFKPLRVVAPTELSKQVDLRDHLPPVYDQGNLGSCTGQALAAAFDFGRKKQGEPFMSPSRLFIYWNERDSIGTVDSDSGAMLRDGIKVLAKLGTPREAVWPHDISQFTVKPDERAYIEAEKNQALVYQRIMRPPEDRTHDMLLCLGDGFPFVTGFTLYQSFESDEVRRTGIVPMPAMDESMLGGHAVVVVGYDLDKQHFICRNSWGEAWGDKGDFYLPFAYLAHGGLSSDQWTIRTVEVHI
jgi:C1A family cysteine protease